MVLMVLKGAGFSAVRHVQFGMFAWRELEMPVEEDPTLVDMPPAKSSAEQALLSRLGYNPETGKLEKSAEECKS